MFLHVCMILFMGGGLRAAPPCTGRTPLDPGRENPPGPGRHPDLAGRTPPPGTWQGESPPGPGRETPGTWQGEPPHPLPPAGKKTAAYG